MQGSRQASDGNREREEPPPSPSLPSPADQRLSACMSSFAFFPLLPLPCDLICTIQKCSGWRPPRRCLLGCVPVRARGKAVGIAGERVQGRRRAVQRKRAALEFGRARRAAALNACDPPLCAARATREFFFFFH